MVIPDVNVLVNAFRQDVPAHTVCLGWLERQLASPDRLGLPSIVLSGFLRVVTHPRIFSVPSRIEKALEFTVGLMSPANVVVLAPARRHWEIFTSLCKSTEAAGNLVADAYLAAIAIEHEAEFVSDDRDFARFPGLRWRHPSEPPLK